MAARTRTRLVRREMAALAEDCSRQGLVERVLVRVRRGAHRLDEGLARQCAFGEVVSAVVRVEDARLQG